jgi:hypothetical protein
MRARGAWTTCVTSLVDHFCGLARLPTPRAVANWLRQFNHDLVTDAMARLHLPRLTIDCRWHGDPHRGDRGLGLPRAESHKLANAWSALTRTLLRPNHPSLSILSPKQRCR